MNKVIYKYDIPDVLPYNKKKFSVNLPMEFKVLSVGTQSDKGVFWVAVDPDEKTWREDFVVLGTGASFDSLSSCEFVGTYFVGAYVWHLFRWLSGE